MKRTIVLLIVLSGFIVIPFAGSQDAGGQNPAQKVFGGAYAELAPQQQRLIQDWADQYSQLAGIPTDPTKLYDTARMSERTTFDAVTHALLHTPLTDANGQSMGTALDLIKSLEQVAGQEPGAGGDRQFRLYVVLKPEAFRILAGSREFVRERDNGTYHHGYPYSFRMNGTPSIQISGSRDFTRADIDVDYRSSQFPQFIFNGHLSASNSDVRAGDNLQRHDGRWSGFLGWWHNLFGFLTPAPVDDPPDEPNAIPANPRIKSKEPLGSAVNDFLASIFLEQKPNIAVSYFSPRSYECINRDAIAHGEQIGAGMARVWFLRELGSAAKAVGTPARLEEVVQAAAPWNPRLKPMRNDHKSLFLLLEVPDDLADVIECDVAAAPGLRKTEYGKYGHYYGSAFQIKMGPSIGSTVYLLWAKEGKYWKIVAFNFADSGGTLSLPKNAAMQRPSSPSLSRVQGNREAVKAMREFLKQWFEKQDYDLALSYLSPRSNACLAESGRPESKEVSQEEAGQLMREDFRLISHAIGRRKLSKAIESVSPSHELLRIVQHGDEKSFTVVDMPDAMGDWFLCGQAVDKITPPELDLNPDRNVYGHYYGMIFRLRVPGEAATLQTLWSFEGNKWKIVAWRTENP